jgi:restriction system protein
MQPENWPASQRRLLQRMAEDGGVLTAQDLAKGRDAAAVKHRQWDLLRLEEAGLVCGAGAGNYRLTSEGRAAAGLAPLGRIPDLTAALRAADADLSRELVRRIHASPPAFFEALVVDLLWSMGYGGRRRDLARRIGKCRDGGVDGLVDRDELGLDTIYVQAKRYAPDVSVPLPDIRDFAGTLDAHRAAKGVFVSTAHFSAAATEFCRQLSRRVALIDGRRLAELMIRYGLGVRIVESWQIKKIDEGYFSSARPTETLETSSASTQPRR